MAEPNPITDADSPLFLPSPPERQHAGLVAIPWSRLGDTDYLEVLHVIAVELAKRKPRKNPLVVWAWHGSLLGHGDEADGPALYLGLTPDRSDAATSLTKLCGRFASRVAAAEPGLLGQGAAPVLAGGDAPGAAWLLLEEVAGRPMARRLEMTPDPTVTFLPAGLVKGLDDGDWAGGASVRYRLAKVRE